MPKHRAVSAAEKDAELEALGRERPRCECHGVLMKWARSPEHLAGGSWRCIEEQRAQRVQYRVKNKEKMRAHYALYRAKNKEKIRRQQADHYARNQERVLARQTRYYDKRATTQTNISVLGDSLGRSICFPEVDRLWRSYQKVVALLERSTGGEKQAAEAAKNRLWTRLQEETSMILGGTEWLHSQTTSAEMRSTLPVTTSLLQLAA